MGYFSYDIYIFLNLIERRRKEEIKLREIKIKRNLYKKRKMKINFVQ
jgi:hypothetical protein